MIDWLVHIEVCGEWLTSISRYMSGERVEGMREGLSENWASMASLSTGCRYTEKRRGGRKTDSTASHSTNLGTQTHTQLAHHVMQMWNAKFCKVNPHTILFVKTRE